MNLNLSDETIEKKATELRVRLGIHHLHAIDMQIVLSILPTKMKKFSVRQSYPNELESGEAYMDCETGTMVLSGEVARELKLVDRRARFTIAHEVGHYLLGHSGNTKRSPDKTKYLTPRQKIQEQQADIFASYLLVPTKLARGCKSPEEIRDRFQVSLQAAVIAFERVESVIRKEKGEQRRPVAAVVDFLKEAERHGYKIKSDLSGFDMEKPSTASVAKKPSQFGAAPAPVAERYSQAVMRGYTGNVCSECLNFTMVRDGNCERCDTCGSTSGCS